MVECEEYYITTNIHTMAMYVCCCVFHYNIYATAIILMLTVLSFSTGVYVSDTELLHQRGSTFESSINLQAFL